MVSVDIWLNKNSLFLLIFFVYCLYTLVKGKFFNNELILSFPDYTEVPSGQLKRFDVPVVDPKCLLKIEATSFCFDQNLSFSKATLYFLVYYYFCFRSTVYMLSKMVLNQIAVL